MKNADGMREVGKATCHAVGAHAGATKNDDTFVVGFFQQTEKEFVFLIGGDGIEGVGDGFGRGLAQTDLDGDRFFEGPLGESFDFGGDGGREKEGLTFLGAEGDDAFDVGEEAHIEHAIDFIKDEVGEMAEVKVSLADEVE